MPLLPAASEYNYCCTTPAAAAHCCCCHYWHGCWGILRTRGGLFFFHSIINFSIRRTERSSSLIPARPRFLVGRLPNTVRVNICRNMPGGVGHCIVSPRMRPFRCPPKERLYPSLPVLVHILTVPSDLGCDVPCFPPGFGQTPHPILAAWRYFSTSPNNNQLKSLPPQSHSQNRWWGQAAQMYTKQYYSTRQQ